MGVHRQRQRGRRTEMRQLAEQLAKLPVARAAAAELLGHPGRKEPVLFERRVVLGRETAVAIGRRGALAEGGSESLNQIEKTLSGWGHSEHNVRPGRSRTSSKN